MAKVPKHMGLDATKSVFEVSDKARLNQSPQLQRLARKRNFEQISLNIILSKKITKGADQSAQAAHCLCCS